VDLRTVTGPELRLDRVFTAADLGPAPEDYRIQGDVRFDGTLYKQEPRYRLAGRVQATLEVNCARCLEPFVLPIDTEVDLTYVPHPTEVGDEEIELKDEDLTTAHYRHHVLDLGDMLREQFYLALPMRVLCREDCRGLCPQCGTNRNHDTCACDVRWEDPRLAGLRALMKKSERQP
jgi:uncharacterized protein